MLLFFRKNNKGKGFRITLFEILIALVFVSIILSIFFLLFRTKSELTIVVKVSEDCRTYDNCYTWPQLNSVVWYNDLFRPGMTEKDTFGKSMADVLKIFKYDDRPGNSVVYLTIKLKALYSPGAKVYSYKGSNVLVGSTIKLVLDGVYVEALVVNMEGTENRYPLKKLLVSAQVIDNNPVFPDTQGEDQFVADNINVGETIKDSRGKTVLKIIGKNIEDADQIVKTAQGEVLLRKNPLLKDINLTMEIMAYQIQNRYFFFGDVPIIVNSQIPVNLKNISIFPVITRIEEVK